MRPRKILDMPEEQFLGALERAVEGLSDEVTRALRALEGERDRRVRADEAIASLSRPRGRPSGARRSHGVRNR